jgi:ABC-type transporter Mla subunit MlaD
MNDEVSGAINAAAEVREKLKEEVGPWIIGKIEDSKELLSVLIEIGAERLEKLEQHREVILERIACIDAMVERIEDFDGLTERVEAAAESFAKHQESLVRNLEEASEYVESITCLTTETVGEFLQNGLSSIEDFTKEVSDTVTRRFGELIDHLEEQRDQATAQIQNLLNEILPDGLIKQAEKLTESLEQLDASGMREISRVSDSVGEIAKKTEVIGKLIEEVKPPLDLVRQIL